jgi:uncharacterized protein (DUF952 family)
MILHIATQAQWEEAEAAGTYRPPSLASEGFIHCSTLQQVVGSANRYFAGCDELCLLCIDEAEVAELLRYEPPSPRPDGADHRAAERFPHLYGPLPLGAVRAVLRWPRGADGMFALPTIDVEGLG